MRNPEQICEKFFEFAVGFDSRMAVLPPTLSLLTDYGESG
jgi:hypothetical protein